MRYPYRVTFGDRTVAYAETYERALESAETIAKDQAGGNPVIISRAVAVVQRVNEVVVTPVVVNS